MRWVVASPDSGGAMSDNPFEPTASPTADSDFGPDTLDPVDLELGALFTRAWQVMRDNLMTVIVVVAIQIGVQVVFSAVNQGLSFMQQGFAEEDQVGMALAVTGVSLILQIAGGILSLWIGLGAIRVFLNMAHGRMASVGMVFQQGDKLVTAIVAGILVGLATFLGLILLIVPGIIVAIALQYVNYEIVDRDADIGSAIKGSWDLAWPHMWLLLGIGLLVLFGVLIGGLLTCGVGFLLAAVYVPALEAVIYQSLRRQQEIRAEIGVGS